MSIYDDIELLGMKDDDHVEPIADHDAIAQMASASIASILDALRESGLDRVAASIGWGVVNAIHREIDRLDKQGDDNAGLIRELIAAQDGSEVRDVELQEAMATQDRIAELREALVTFREAGADAYATATGEPWLPRSGSRTGHGVTAAQIDARAMLKARRDKAAAELDPDGPRFAITGPVRWDDANVVMAALDTLRARRPDMVLVTKGGRGVETIARKWAALRGVPCVTVTPNWADGKRAPFMANDTIIAMKPVGVVLFEGATPAITGGVALNLGQKAEARGVPVWRPALPRATHSATAQVA